MDQRLEAVTGPLKGVVFPIVGERVSIGSDPSNELSIYDASIAAAHCLITCRGGVVAVTDLESGQGTFVNGVPVRERILEDRDVITIGDCELVFRNGSEIAPSNVENSRRNEVFDHLPAPILRQSPPLLPPLVTDVGRMARDLNALFKIAKAINSQRDLESLQKGVLQLIFEVVPADAGAIQIIDNAEGQPNSTVTWSREDSEAPEINVRHEVVLRTLWERSEVVYDLTSATLQPEQVLCVPLVALQKTIGVIYLASYSPANNFERDHVNFVSSVASIAAVTLESVLSMESLRAENRQLREQLAADEPMIGESLPMRQLTETVDKVAKGDSAVLIRGESGVGKEIVARAIHSKSSRAAQPFIAINCAAIPDTLIESELFGYEKGAFTGAVVSKRGKLELAAGGTLFLDEIGELDPKLQAKLLRILQEREFERVGGTNTIRFNARVLAATNKDLEHAIETKEFRQDLFYRLNVVSVSVPPLREHRQDIPLLAIHFARKYSQRLARPFKGISPEARALLVNYSWPGNVRELENAIEHALIMGSSDSILPIDLPETLHNEDGVKHGAGGYHDAVSDFKKRIIQEAMRKSGDNCAEAARMLGVHPNYLHRLIKKLGVKGKQTKSSLARHVRRSKMEQQVAALARGNGARSQRPDTKAKRAALLLDMENFYISRKDAFKQTNPREFYSLVDDLRVLKNWMRLTLGETRPTLERGYADFGSFPWMPEILMSQGIEPVQVYALAGKRKPTGNGKKDPAGEKVDTRLKNAVDLRIAMDAAYAVVNPQAPVECIILAAGDADYVPVMLQLRSLGAEALVVGSDNSASHLMKSTAPKLRNFASRFWFFDEIEKEYEDMVKKDVKQEQQDGVPHSAKFYETILGKRPRFELVPKESWIGLTNKLFAHMAKSQPETLKFWVDFIHAESEELGFESGYERDVIRQLLHSECFKPVPDGTASSDEPSQWERRVCLAPGIDSAVCMRLRTQKKIVSVLKERLKTLGDKRHLEKEIVAEMFFGPNPTPSELQTLYGCFNGQK